VTKVHHQKTTPRKCYIYSNANWNTINKDLNTLNEIVKEKQKNGADVHQLWDIFKKHLFGTMNNNIPKKDIKSRNNIPWVKRKERNSGYANKHEQLINGPTIERSKKHNIGFES
jgi:hypothetical protein